MRWTTRDFVTLEDDTGAVNVIVWPQVAEQQRRVALGAPRRPCDLVRRGQPDAADGRQRQRELALRAEVQRLAALDDVAPAAAE